MSEGQGPAPEVPSGVAGLGEAAVTSSAPAAAVSTSVLPMPVTPSPSAAAAVPVLPLSVPLPPYPQRPVPLALPSVPPLVDIPGGGGGAVGGDILSAALASVEQVSAGQQQEDLVPTVGQPQGLDLGSLPQGPPASAAHLQLHTTSLTVPAPSIVSLTSSSSAQPPNPVPAPVPALTPGSHGTLTPPVQVQVSFQSPAEKATSHRHQQQELQPNLAEGQGEENDSSRPDLSRVKQESAENGSAADSPQAKQAAEQPDEPPQKPDYTDDELMAGLRGPLESLELTCSRVDDWLVIQRSRFDLKVFDEPFQALQLMLQPSTGRYLRRVWGKTRERGRAGTVAEASAALEASFRGTVPCLGFFDFRDGFSMNREDMVAVEFPVPRVVSKDCLVSYSLDQDSAAAAPTVPELLGVGLCSMCLRGSKSEGERDGGEDDGGSDSYAARRKMKKEEGGDSDPDYFYGMPGDWSDSSDYEDDDEEEDYEYGDHGNGDDDEVIVGGGRRKRGPGRPRKTDAPPARKRRTIVRDGRGRKRYQCDDCGRGFNQPRSLDKHRESHHMAGRFTCTHCRNFECGLAWEHYEHVTGDHPGVEYRCESCGEEAFGPGVVEEFKEHYVNCFRSKERDARKEKRLSQNTGNKKKPHQCEECGKTFAARTTFEEHKNWHKGLKPIKCPDCDFSTCFSTSLYTHSKIHMRERGMEVMNNDIPLVHVCELCGNKYNQANQLRTHIKRIHEGVVEKRECGTCGAVFTNRQNLRRHVARVHPKDPSLQCTICGHVCADRYAFSLHERVHREPDFMCRFCGKAVKSKQTLQAHERSHTGENPYKCDMCEYACKSSSVLNRHKQAKHNMQPGPPRVAKT